MSETGHNCNIHNGPCDCIPSEISNDLDNCGKDYQANHFFFTINNYTVWQKREIPNLKYVTQYLFQQEKGKEGTPHLQGYLYCKERTRATKIQKDLRCKFFITRAANPEHVKRYCSKPQTRDGSIFSNILIPRHPESLTWEQLRPVQKEVIDIVLHREPDDRHIYVYHGDVGMGKSKIIRYLRVNHPKEVVIIPNGKSSDILNHIVQKDMTYVKAVILNLTKGTSDSYPYEALEQIKDAEIACGKYKGGDKSFAYVHVIIFANEPPYDFHLIDEKRFIIKKIV
nr:MAG: replication associated protein [Cressdnaviricota sp.]